MDNVALSAVDDTLPLKIWRRLPKWEDEAPPPPAGARPVSRDAALDRLADIIGKGAETRPAQRDFTSVACEAFQPREAPGIPGLVLAEAGTGTGKTAGYLAPASVWAEKNGGTVWVSTYTRHLQKQIERELHALFPDRVMRRRKIVIRKGRENYLCLLNYEDSVNVFAARPDRSAAPMGILLALVARWASMTEDGDLIGGDLPGWFFDLRPRDITEYGGPARGVHLQRLPALSELLRRAFHPSRQIGGNRGGQSCPRYGAIRVGAP
ncbi:MAG: DEAD/DEAH box helicase [Acetobacteraceae bacterium]